MIRKDAPCQYVEVISILDALNSVPEIIKMECKYWPAFVCHMSQKVNISGAKISPNIGHNSIPIILLIDNAIDSFREVKFSGIFLVQHGLSKPPLIPPMAEFRGNFDLLWLLWLAKICPLINYKIDVDKSSIGTLFTISTSRLAHCFLLHEKQ